jgi:hypothetical protein
MRKSAKFRAPNQAMHFRRLTTKRWWYGEADNGLEEVTNQKLYASSVTRRGITSLIALKTGLGELEGEERYEGEYRCGFSSRGFWRRFRWGLGDRRNFLIWRMDLHKFRGCVIIFMKFVSLLLSLLVWVVLAGVCWNYGGSVEHNYKWLSLGSH